MKVVVGMIKIIFLKTQPRDKVKNQYCIENNLILIRIPYTHRKNIALEDLLPKTSKFIYKEISTE